MSPANLPLLSPGSRNGMIESLIYMFGEKPFTVRHIKNLAASIDSSKLTKVSPRSMHDSIHQSLNQLIKAGRVEVFDHHAHRNVYRCTFRPSDRLTLLREFLSHARKSNGEIAATEPDFLEFLAAYSAAQS